jgi:hypothetical protein
MAAFPAAHAFLHRRTIDLGLIHERSQRSQPDAQRLGYLRRALLSRKPLSDFLGLANPEFARWSPGFVLGRKRQAINHSVQLPARPAGNSQNFGAGENGP